LGGGWGPRNEKRGVPEGEKTLTRLKKEREERARKFPEGRSRGKKKTPRKSLDEKKSRNGVRGGPFFRP